MLGVGLFGAPAVAQSDRYIDSLFRAGFPASGPGAAVAVIRDGKLAHLGLHGLARTSLRAGISAWVDALLDTSFVPARDKDEMFRQRIDTYPSFRAWDMAGSPASETT